MSDKINSSVRKFLAEQKAQARKTASKLPMYQGSQRQKAQEWGRIGENPDHEHLLACMIRLPNDYDPYGYVDRDKSGAANSWNADCSCGCKWYLGVTDRQDQPITDWGVCSNPRSHRCGLLTFEHQGCPQFEPEDDDADESDPEDA